LELKGERAHITEPRVLNGAQTITSLAKFIESYVPDRNVSPVPGKLMLL
jgi:hypothetical protein